MRITQNMNVKSYWSLYKNLQFVPHHLPAMEKDIKKLENFLMDKPNILVLTGAGISTESGILFEIIK